MALTQIIDTWYNADGSLFTGTLVITPTPQSAGAIVYADTQSITQRAVTVQIQGGAVNFSLQANDIAQPSGTTYSVLVYAGRQVSWTETWTVPTSTAPVSLAAVRGLAQSLRRAAYFPPSLSWLLPASVYGTSALIPLILTYDQNGNQVIGNPVRNLATGDTTINWAVSQQGVAEVLLTPLQFSETITNATSVTITNTAAGLSNLVGVVVLDASGNYISSGVNITFSLIAASPATAQGNAGLGGATPFGSNFSGAFQSVKVSFAVAQTGTILLLGS